MNKSLYVIACLLCATNILAMRGIFLPAKSVLAADNIVKCANEKNLLKLNKSIGELFKEGGIRAVKLQLADLQIRATKEVINYVNEDGTALENAYSEENEELFLLLLKNGADPSLSIEGKDSVLCKAKHKKEYLSLVSNASKINAVQIYVNRANDASSEELTDIIADLKACDEFDKYVEETLELLKKEKLIELQKIESLQVGFKKQKWIRSGWSNKGYWSRDTD